MLRGVPKVSLLVLRGVNKYIEMKKIHPNWPIILCLCLWATLLVLCSCSKKIYVPVESVRIDTFVKSAVRVDSVRLTDSVYVVERMQGDTFYITKTKTQWRDRVRLVTDTIYRSKVDTITKIVEVPAKKSGVKISPWLIISAFLAIIAIFVVKKS